MRTIEARIIIDAPATAVWQVLQDTERYPIWNPFITAVVGELVAGARPTLRIVAQGKAPMTFRPRVVAASPETGLRWLGHLVVPGLCDADHEILLIPAAGGTTMLVQRETFRGALVPFLGGMLAPTGAAFEAMNSALKQRVERREHRPQVSSPLGPESLQSCAPDTTASNRARSLSHEAECSAPVPGWRMSTHGGAAR